jgi:Tfp pilus assembly pilus retraction ATPase PilT
MDAARARIDGLLELVVETGASDLHYVSGQPPILRNVGELVPLRLRASSADEVAAALR